jgi:hypothetical protein
MTPPPTLIGEIFREDIRRNIEEVIKVDDLDDAILVEEIREYHPTPSIQEQMAKVLEAYSGARQGETQKIGVWVSGFFGAGKSSFAKLLGILLESRRIGDQDAVDLFSKRITDQRIKVLLQQIREHLPTHVVIFDILKDNIAGAQEHPVTTVMYKALLRSLGYAVDLDLSELEINLEQREELAAFEARYEEIYKRPWSERKSLKMTALGEASRVMHELDRDTYPSPTTWKEHRPHAEISPRLLAERALSLSKSRADGRNVVFVVDEIGQYTARDLTRIGDLQGVVESFSQVGRGKIWLIATSQEKLEAVLDIYEKDKSELVRLKERFAFPVDIKSTDIREVASHRVLAKSAAAESALRALYEASSGKLKTATNVSAAVQLPPLEEDAFIQLYPLLPYQVDLLINVVSGLRSQEGGPQTMGGANRTIIKLAQQLLIHDGVGLADKPLGALVTLDSVYDLISTNIASELQQEIDEIGRHVDHPFAAPVAKALSLLQFAEAVHPSEENLAAVLHPAVDAASVLPKVREAVKALIDARKIRRTEHGLKIQSAAERTWDEERDARQPTPGDRSRIVKEVLEQVWGKGATQQPHHQLGNSKRFIAGLRVGSESLVAGDVPFEVRLIDPSRSSEEQTQEARKLTQQPDQNALVTWIIELSGDAEDAIRERHRSERMQQRGARSREEEGLMREEGRRLREASRKLREEVERALCRGRIYFRGNDRSPDDAASEPKAEARRVLGSALEQIFHRFGDGDVKVGTHDVEAILKSESLAGLPDCYSDLKVVQTIDGQTRLVTDQGAAKEILDWIRQRCDGGQAPSGREVEQHFKTAPFGWGLDLVQLVVATLLREGRITLLSGSQHLKHALTPEARKAITSNTAFRALTVSLRESSMDPQKLRDAARALEQSFGTHCSSLTAESIAGALREHLGSEIPRLEQARDLLRDLALPGDGAIEQGLNTLRAIKSGDDEDAIQSFLESADTLRKAITRGRGIGQSVTEPARVGLERALAAHQQVGPVLERETEGDDPAREALTNLHDHLESETFYEHLPAIESAAATVLDRFHALYSEAFAARRQAYADALETLYRASGWSDLKEAEQADVEQRLRERSAEEPLDEPWRQAAIILGSLCDQADAAKGLLDAALEALRKLVTPQAVEINVRALLSGPISNQEELDAALAAIRDEIERALADGKPVVLV